MGATNVLGALAAGYSDAAAVDRQRKFEIEQSQRGQTSDWLAKLAGDPTAHPESRQKATQALMQIQQQPLGKFKPPKMEDLLAASPMPPMQQAPAPPPGMQPGTPLGPNDLPPQTGVSVGATGPERQPPPSPEVTQFQPPTPPPSIWMSPEEQAGHAATATSLTTTAQIEAQIKARGALVNSLVSQGLSPEEASQEASVILGHAFPWQMSRPQSNGQVKIFDPSDPTKTIDAAMYRYPDGRVEYRTDKGVIPNPNFVPPGWTPPKTTSKSSRDASGFQTTNTSTTSVSGSPTKPTPPPGSTAAAPSGGGKKSQNKLGAATQAYNGLNNVGKSQVDAAADTLATYGYKPGAKLDKAGALAYQKLKEDGIDIPTMATAGAMGQADVAKMIQPLIARARDLITQNPDALGPLSGRWSELSQKVGTLSGAPKELAGTLISIYSLAGKLHGWRAIGVADKFREAYGDLSDTPASLNSGLDAMQNTTQNIINVGYPGKKNAPTPPPGMAHPATHVFDSTAWKAANPKGDVEAAKKAAKAQGYEVK